jgi:hypothetical protein
MRCGWRRSYNDGADRGDRGDRGMETDGDVEYKNMPKCVIMGASEYFNCHFQLYLLHVHPHVIIYMKSVY